MSNANLLLNEKEASTFLGIAKGTLAVWRSTRRYGLPYLKIGRLVRYRRKDLDTWLQNRAQVSKSN